MLNIKNCESLPVNYRKMNALPCYYMDDYGNYYFKTKKNTVEGPFVSAKLASCHAKLSIDIEEMFRGDDFHQTDGFKIAS